MTSGSTSPLPLGVAPSVAMDAPRLPRRGLSTGAVGHGAGGRRYRLLAPMERGGMGELFLAEASAPGQPNRKVVIKRLLADLVDEPKYVAMFRSEAEVMGRLAHPNIVRVYDTPVIEQAQCLAMEFVRGKSALQILSRAEDLGVRVPPTVALRVMAAILRGLAYAHALTLDDGTPLELVHRDVSPGNVLVSLRGDVKLTDFGIAKSQMSVVSTTVGIVKGKARYLAPEQILGEAATPRSDIFSAASVTCELLTGMPTFDCSSVPKTLYAIVNGTRDDLAAQLPFRAPGLVQLLDRALATDPSARVQTAQELADGLEASARIIAPQTGDPELGPWLADLFRGEPDSLGLFFAPPTPAHEHAATEHAYAPMSPAEAQRRAPTMRVGHGGGDAGLPTEVLNRPSSTAVAAFGAAGPGAETQPPAPPPKSHRPRTVVEAELVDSAPVRVTPVEDLDAAPAAFPRSAAEADPTQVVRARARPAARGESVDEALSMLAYLQAEARRPTAAAAARAPPRAREVDDEPLPDLRPRLGRSATVFLLGLAVGVAGTLGAQSVLRGPEPPRIVEAPAAQVPAPPPAAAAEAPVPAPPPRPAPTLDVVYPRGARVYLDGERLDGRAPLSGVTLAPGEHTLVVRKRRYRRKVTFTAEPGDRFEMQRTLSRLD